MSTNTDIQQARQLIAEECYDDAKAILHRSSDPKAQEWLKWIETMALYPANQASLVSHVCTNDDQWAAQTKMNGNGQVTNGERPKVAVLVGLICFGSIASALNAILSLNELAANKSLVVPAGSLRYLYSVLGLSVLGLVSAALISRYHRWGLNVGLIVFGFGVCTRMLLMILIEASGMEIIAAALFSCLLFYIWRLRTHMPESSFFT